MGKYKRHAIPENGDSSLSPAMDVIVQQCLNAILKTLLIFFILAASLAIPTRIELSLPESTSGVKASPDKRLVVTYRLQANLPEITLNAQTLKGLEFLGPAMKSLSGNEKTPVDIQIDRGVPYQDVIALIDTVRDAGFPKFSLLTLPRKSSPTQ